MKILITGAAGFIGYHVAQQLLNAGHEVTGLDNLNDYYDPSLKHARLNRLAHHVNFRFEKIDLANQSDIIALFKKQEFQRVIHLAAQAGVRYSIENPHSYANSNLVGFLNILEACRHYRPEHFLFASSSSVYGLNSKVPFSVSDHTDHPVSLYAATKKSNEMMAHAYSHLYKIPTTGLRFFTVYGPWGRPDMAPFLFTKAILEGSPIKVFNHGQMKRDFTYIDDVTDGVIKLSDVIPTINPEWDTHNPNPATSSAAYRLYNIGNNNSVQLSRFIAATESALGTKAVCEYLPMQPGDVTETAADIDALQATTGFKPSTSIEDGMQKFCHWYRDFYKK